MNLTKNYINFTTQTPYTKGVQQPQNQNFATAPRSASQPRKDVFVKTAQPSFKGRGASELISPLQEFMTIPLTQRVLTPLRAADDFLSQRQVGKALEVLTGIPDGLRTSDVDNKLVQVVEQHPDAIIQGTADAYRAAAKIRAEREAEVVSGFESVRPQISEAVKRSQILLKSRDPNGAYAALINNFPEVGKTSTYYILLFRAASHHTQPAVKAKAVDFYDRAKALEREEQTNLLKRAINERVQYELR